MRRGNIISGGAFTAAFYSLASFVIILAILGSVFYHTVSSAMMTEVESQVTEESSLLQEIFQRDGLDGLVDAVNKANIAPTAYGDAIGLFDANEKKLAGNVTSAPDFYGWAFREFDNLAPQLSGTYRLFSVRLTGNDPPVTLVTGQNLQLIQRTEETVLRSLYLAGLIVSLLTMAVGYFISRAVYKKLEKVSATLEDISHGTISSRIPISLANDQIDRMARQINKHLDRLSVLTAATKNTINAVAHDLRAPLSRASIKLQGLIDQHSQNAQTSEQLNLIDHELKNLGVVFETILRISRLETDQARTNLLTVDLAQIITDIIETYEPVLQDKGQFLLAKADKPEGFLVRGDRSMLFQMVANLIENIAKYAPSGSTAQVSCQNMADGSCLLAVGDNGHGIPEEQRAEMLLPFKRMEASRTSEGNGLGLALVNAIALYHKATLALKDNRPGLRVEILFPPLPEN